MASFKSANTIKAGEAYPNQKITEIQAILDKDKAEKLAATVPGVEHTISVPGFSLFNGVNISNSATMFVTLAPFEKRKHNPEMKQQAIYIMNQVNMLTLLMFQILL